MNKILDSLEKEDLLSVIIWLAKYQEDLNQIRTECFKLTPVEIKDRIISHWPVMQGTKLQVWLTRIGELPCSKESLNTIMPILGEFATEEAIKKL